MKLFKYLPWSRIDEPLPPTSEEISTLLNLANFDGTHSPLNREVNSEIIITILQEHFGRSVEIEDILPLSAARFTTAYCCQLGNPQMTLYIKFSARDDGPLLNFEQRTIVTEKTAYEILQHRTVIPVPNLIKADTSRHFLDRDYLITEVVEGSPLNEVYQRLSIRQEEEIMRKVGDTLAELHLLTSNTWGSIPSVKSYDSWKSFFLERLYRLLQDLQENNILSHSESQQLINCIKKMGSSLDGDYKPSFLHMDFWLGNIIVREKADNWEVAAIIDFDRVLWGHAEYELATIEVQQLFTEPFYKAYLDKCPVSSLYSDRKFLYQLHWFLEYLFLLKVGRYPSNGLWKQRKEELIELIASLN